MTHEQAQYLLEHLSDISDSLSSISSHLAQLNVRHESVSLKLDGIEDNLLHVANSTHDVQERLGSLCLIQEAEHVVR